MQSSAVKIVSTKPSHLEWYHRVYIFGLSAMVLAVLVFLIYEINSDEATGDMRTKVFSMLVFSGAIWYHSVYRFLYDKPTLEYNGHEILFYKNSFIEMVGPLPFSAIQHAVRRSPNCIELQLLNPKAFIRRLSKYPERDATMDNFNIQGNEKHLDELSATLSSHQIAVTQTPVPDDDPLKSSVLLFVVLGGFVVGIIGFIFFLVWMFPISK